MSFKETIQNDLSQAMRDQDELLMSTLRLLVSAVKNKQIELKHDLTDDDILKIIASQAKQRQDSIEAYRSANRTDLVTREEAELNVLKKYLPEQLPTAEIEAIVKKVITDMQASKADFGKVIGATMLQIRGRADGKTVSEIIKRIL